MGSEPFERLRIVVSSVRYREEGGARVNATFQTALIPSLYMYCHCAWQITRLSLIPGANNPLMTFWALGTFWSHFGQVSKLWKFVFGTSWASVQVLVTFLVSVWASVHIFGHILGKCPNFGHFKATFWTPVQILVTFWSHFWTGVQILVTFWAHFGHIWLKCIDTYFL